MRMVDGALYTSGAYERGNLSYQHRMIYTSNFGLAGTVSATAGYGALYIQSSPGMGILQTGATGGLNANASYSASLDTANTLRSQSTANASSAIVGVGLGAITQGTLGEVLMWQASRNTSVTGGVFCSQAFQHLGATTLSEQAGFNTPLAGGNLSVNASHTNRFVATADSTGIHRSVYEDLNAWQRFSGAITGTRVSGEIYVAEQFSSWQLVTMNAQASLRATLVDQLLSAHAAYGLGRAFQSLDYSQKFAVGATMAWRAVTLTMEYSALKTGPQMWSNLYLTLTRPFSIL